MNWRQLIHIIGIVFIVFYCQSEVRAAESADTANFITVADIHFDPFAGCAKEKSCKMLLELQNAPIEQWRAIFENHPIKTTNFHDTSYKLLHEVLTQLKNTNQTAHTEFILILGDFIAHDLHQKYKKYSGKASQAHYETFVKKIFQFLAREWMETFPGVDVYVVIGNRDTYSGNYRSIPRGQFFRDMTKIWSPLIHNNENRKNFIENFPTVGYYNIQLTHPNNQLIILNTVIFSKKKQNKFTEKEARSELEWLNKKLQLIKLQNKKVLLAYHIPAGIDMFTTVKQFGKLSDFWHSEYTKHFTHLMNHYGNNIAGILVGHLHVDVFQRLALTKFDSVKVYITPSISPVYGNNPAFKIITYDKTTLSIKNVTTYTYQLNQTDPEWEKH